MFLSLTPVSNYMMYTPPFPYPMRYTPSFTSIYHGVTLLHPLSPPVYFMSPWYARFSVLSPIVLCSIPGHAQSRGPRQMLEPFLWLVPRQVNQPSHTSPRLFGNEASNLLMFGQHRNMGHNFCISGCVLQDFTSTHCLLLYVCSRH